MLSVRKFEILLDRPDHKFAPGEIVAGRLFVELDEPQTIRGIKVKVEGEASVEWSYKETGFFCEHLYTEYFRNYEPYINIERYVLVGAKNSDEVQIQAGSHIYPFEFRLPLNIPNTMSTCYGEISYRVRGIVDRSGRSDQCTAKDVIVEAPHDLSNLPIIAIDDKQNNPFRFLYFFGIGSMEVDIFLATSDYAIGETIEVKINLDNKSKSVNVTGVEVRLEQKIMFHAAGGRRRTSNNNTLKTVTHGGPYTKKDGIVKSIKVPRVHCSNATEHCTFIDLEYRLCVEIEVSDCHWKICRNYPIQIGSKSPKSLQSVQPGDKNSAYISTVEAFPVQSQTAMNTMPGIQSPTKTRNELSSVASSIPSRSYGSISSTITSTAPLLDDYSVNVDEK